MTTFGISQRLLQTVGAVSDSSGNATFTFLPPPMGSAWTGTLTCPGAPDNASFVATVLGIVWANWEGGYPAGPVQAFNNETVTVQATGLKANTAYNMIWQGIADRDIFTVPISPTVIQTPASVPLAPFYPPQTPPPTGYNTYLDASGEVWVSFNGSAWKRARDCVRARAYKQAPWTTTVGATIAFDNISYDPLLSVNLATGIYTCPTGGYYLVTTQLIATANGAGQSLRAQITKNGSAILVGAAAPLSTATGNVIGTVATDLILCGFQDTLSIVLFSGTNGLTGATGPLNNIMTIQWLSAP